MRSLIRLRNPQDLAAGLFLVAFAAFAWYLASDLPMGRLVRMGPGYLPVVLCWLLGGIGVIIAARGFTIEGPRLERWAWRPLIALCASLIVFGFLLERAGLALTIIATTLIASLAAPGIRWISTLILGAVLAVMSTILFVWLLGLPLQIWPEFG
ncbi:MAG: tripartite tricarboxylate transporter TctB family protein [Acetobacteraceae bacterium]